MFGKKTAKDNTDSTDFHVLFVCMGNICRSPTAQGVFQHFVNKKKLDKKIAVDSAGTYSYHIGKKPDPRAMMAAAKRGYDLSKIRSRKVIDSDFEKFDYVLAMDSENHEDLLNQCPGVYQNKIKFFLEFSPNSNFQEVPDPYYGGVQGFEVVLDLVEETSQNLLSHIEKEYLG